ncbi:MAG: DUF4293 domain-containing protein [bacterium]
MIQRIQSLWLLLSTMCAALIWIIPIFGGVGSDNLPKAFSIRESLILMFIVALASIVPFITIFLFKSRGTQKKLIIINIILGVTIIATEYLMIEQFKTTFGIVQGNWQLSAILPFFIILFNFFAYRGIVHDEKLLSSADRMR